METEKLEEGVQELQDPGYLTPELLQLLNF
jgi:hypothetical protein